jgi:hypothetical protein
MVLHRLDVHVLYHMLHYLDALDIIRCQRVSKAMHSATAEATLPLSLLTNVWPWRIADIRPYSPSSAGPLINSREEVQEQFFSIRNEEVSFINLIFRTSKDIDLRLHLQLDVFNCIVVPAINRLKHSKFVLQCLEYVVTTYIMMDTSVAVDSSSFLTHLCDPIAIQIMVRSSSFQSLICKACYYMRVLDTAGRWKTLLTLHAATDSSDPNLCFTSASVSEEHFRGESSVVCISLQLETVSSIPSRLWDSVLPGQRRAVEGL